MMILVAVSVAIIIRSDLLGTAKSAGESWKSKSDEESGMKEVTIDGVKYASIEDYIRQNSGSVVDPENPGDEDPEDEIISTDTNYVEKGNIFVSAPDLTGFNANNTYYVTYNDAGENETIEGNISGTEPSSWYDYEDKIWANIVTASEPLTSSEKSNMSSATTKSVSYWVWIPRYCYKIIYYTDEDLTQLSPQNAVTSYGKVDVKFLSKDNIYKYKKNGETRAVRYETLEAEGYALPEAFTWGEGTVLSGYWVAKYELSGYYKIYQ